MDNMPLDQQNRYTYYVSVFNWLTEIHPAIISAIIAAIGSVATAFIVRSRRKEKASGETNEGTITLAQFFLFGADVSKILWSRLGALKSEGVIEKILPTQFELLRIPDGIQDEFNHILGQIHTKEVAKTHFPRIGSLLGVFISTRYGDPVGEYFALGFDLIGTLPMLDELSDHPEGLIDPAIEQLNAIALRVEALGLRNVIIREAQKLLTSGRDVTGHEFILQARELMVRVGKEFGNHLDQVYVSESRKENRNLVQIVKKCPKPSMKHQNSR